MYDGKKQLRASSHPSIIMTRKRSASWYKRRGAEMIEFTLILMPLMGFTFLLLDLGWVIYKRATLQFAVREGCRYAVTNQQVVVGSKVYGVSDSIKIQVQGRAMGFLGKELNDLGKDKANQGDVVVRYYCAAVSTTCTASQVNLATALSNPTDCSDKTTPLPNQGGNLVEVSVEGFQAHPLMPILRDTAPFTFIARSSDRMESNPLRTDSSGNNTSVAPPVLTCP
jgi:Flp pilus assembly protein TadG